MRSQVADPGIAELFEQARCDGQLCVQSLDGSQELAIDADRPAVAASVIKVCVAIEAETQFADGRLDPLQQVILPSAGRTPGPIGFSIFDDDVSASLRDLVVAMLTISDNAATDALLAAAGLDAVNASMARLGLTGTFLIAEEGTIVNSIGREAGFAGWAAMWDWAEQPHTQQEEDDLVSRIVTSSALDPARTTVTTARDMATLLRLIWTDQAGPPAACKRVRGLMARQLTRHRLAAGFPAPAKVAAKSGSLTGVVRNEAGVITFPDGRGYAAAVTCQAHRPWRDDAAINAVIAAAAAAAVTACDPRGPG
jgi:beta-lactamase class A